jgi:hypothetical protein
VASTLNQEVKEAESAVTQSYNTLSADPKAITQLTDGAAAATAAPADTAAAINAAANAANAATAGNGADAIDPVVDPFGPLPEVASFKDPAHDVSVQRMEADILIDEIAKLEERLAQLRRNAETARNMAA